MHDHHPYCVTLYAQFEGECRQCDRQKLQRCINENPGHRFFKGVQADDWQALREAFVATVQRHRPRLVAPSRSVALRWQALMPELQDGAVQVIEHGLNMAPARTFETPPDGPLRVVVLGRLSAEKGRGLLAEMLPQMNGWAEVLLLGCGEADDPIKQYPHVTPVEYFDPADLGEQIAGWRPHLGLLTSTVPETFSYALSELWHCGVPVLACGLGALADRIRDGENGFLAPPSAPALLQRLSTIHRNRAGLAAVRARVQQQRTRSMSMMLDDYVRALGMAPRTRPVPLTSTTPPMLDAVPPPKLRGPARWLHVSPEATWLQAARGFAAYTRHKAANSPRLPAGLRRWLKG
jgi:glycosyltransferase involved in cell wall biosynthesis